MVPVRQRVLGTMHGDCLRAALASVLELPYEEVPHFADDGWKPGEFTGEWERAVNDWLMEAGYPFLMASVWYPRGVSVHVEGSFDERYETRAQPAYHPGFWLATVCLGSYEDSAHIVVMRGSRVVHDPDPAGPADGSGYRYASEHYFTVPDPTECVRVIGEEGV